MTLVGKVNAAAVARMANYSAALQYAVSRPMLTRRCGQAGHAPANVSVGGGVIHSHLDKHAACTFDLRRRYCFDAP